MKLRIGMATFWLYCLMLIAACGDGPDENQPPVEPGDFYFGADLSFVNQILDHGGVYKDGGAVLSPYKILKDNGANLARFRLWHNPVWTKEVYGVDGTQLYNDKLDVEKSIKLSREQGMDVLLDFHYSDTWADPGNQKIPEAWKNIKTIEVLGDSVYNYTFSTLQYLNGKGLMPELVQIGNETNCGMMYSNALAGFPPLNVCNGNWDSLGIVINRAIKAIKDVSATSTVKTKIILHVADPKNVEWWFDNMTDPAKGNVKNFDFIGFSYYPLWHTTVPVEQLSDNVSKFKSKYAKEVIIMETAYPWTTEGDDSYNNLFGSQTPVSGFAFTKQGQMDIMKKIVQEMKDGGGAGVIYWEPAWISSNMKDQWGTGSSWENNTFFDFDGNSIQVMDYMTADYK